VSTYSRETYSEVCEFLGLLGNKYTNKIPNKLLRLFENNKSEKYVPHIDPDISIKEQNLNEDTLTIIAILNLKYWCKDEEEIKRLKTIYKNNEDKYQKKLEKTVNSNDIFKNKRETIEIAETTEMIKYKPLTFYEKIILRLKKLFGII